MNLSNFLSAKISQVFKKPKDFIVGVSGGPDSVALLSLLVEAGYKPIVAHINYHLRGAASTADQKLVEKLATKYGLKIEIHSAYPAKMPGNLENNCREIRYEFFEAIRVKRRAAGGSRRAVNIASATAILVAHNLNDQTETFLLNLTRGARLRGFQAMKEWDSKRHLFRPLLSIEKNDLLKYLTENKIPFRKDESNDDLKFSRNFLRHKIIPLFQKLNPNFHQTLSSTIENLSTNWEIIDQQTERWIKTNFKQNSFPLNAFLAEPIALQKQILSRLYEKISDLHLATPTLNEIRLTLTKNRAGLRKEFGQKHLLEISKSAIRPYHRMVKIIPIKTRKP